MTGLFLQQLELAKKRLQLFRDAFPDVHAATMFWYASSKDQWIATTNAAPEFVLHVSGIELTRTALRLRKSFSAGSTLIAAP